MRKLASIRDAVLGGLAFIGAMATVLLMLHVATDIALRNLFNAPVPATFIIVTNYYMPALAFLPLAWLEKSGGMIQVELINGALSPTIMRVSDLLVAVISAVLYGILALVTWRTAMSNTALGSFILSNQTPIPIWPAYWLPPLGFGLAAMAAMLRVPGLMFPRLSGMETHV
jgi:TRAP-type C4-dicarboxylate transport system permease small subunit